MVTLLNLSPKTKKLIFLFYTHIFLLRCTHYTCKARWIGKTLSEKTF